MRRLVPHRGAPSAVFPADNVGIVAVEAVVCMGCIDRRGQSHRQHAGIHHLPLHLQLHVSRIEGVVAVGTRRRKYRKGTAVRGIDLVAYGSRGEHVHHLRSSVEHWMMHRGSRRDHAAVGQMLHVLQVLHAQLRHEVHANLRVKHRIRSEGLRDAAHAIHKWKAGHLCSRTRRA